MSTLHDLLARKAALEEEIEATQKRERHEAIAKIKSLMTEYGLTSSDLAAKPPGKPSSAKGGKVAAKYRNESTGETWSGRGLQPKWLKAAVASGKRVEDFAI